MADHSSENENSGGAPQLKDLRPKLRALIPQNLQARILAGVALVMTLVILFSGRQGANHTARPTPPPPATQAADPNLQRIQEYRAGIEAATKQLAAEEAQLAQTRQAMGPPPARAGSLAMPAQDVSPRVARSRDGAPYTEPSPAPGRGDAGKHMEQSLFASNVALSYRSAPKLTDRNAVEERRVAEPLASSPPSLKDEPWPYRLLEGTVIETVLTNRLDSTFSGPVNCMVTTNVYSTDRTALLIPQGSRVLGEVRKVESLGEQRLAVFFHRLIRPDGYSANLDRFQGLSQEGETGLLDQVNHHYLQIFGAAIAIGGIAGLAQANTRYGADQTAANAYEQGVAASLSQSSIHILDRYLNVLPTFTVREGHRVKVYLSQDLSLPAYSGSAKE